jgi:SAM-dependent methyltransferase
MAARTTYDEVRYSNHPYAQTHPDRLATVAALHGLPAPDPSTCRVLELGCGAGGNLLAMAAATPALRAVGVDLAAEPIAEAQAAAAAVGLDGVEFRQGDVNDLRDGELGEFDYVIAHGVYAWIPPDARDSLLAAIHSHLAADGLAFVSYNAYPGGYLRRALREAGLWFARDVQDGPAATAERARVLFRYLLEERADEGDPWGSVLSKTLPPLTEGPVYRLVHDDLGEFWEPVWFAAFVEHAARHRLGYVGDADLGNLLPARLPGEIEPGLRELAAGDRIVREQVTDMLRCNFFRQSVLCRDTRVATPDPTADAMYGLSFAARAGGGAAPSGLLAEALEPLRAHAPETIPFGELRRGLGAEAEPLAEALLEGFRTELVMPHTAPLRVADANAERPVASRLARWQAAQGPDITSLAYTNVHLAEPAARALITLLDGTRDRATVRAEFADRTGMRLSAEDLDANLAELARLFILAP